eukprot:gene8342-28519_t
MRQAVERGELQRSEVRGRATTGDMESHGRRRLHLARQELTRYDQLMSRQELAYGQL